MIDKKVLRELVRAVPKPEGPKARALMLAYAFVRGKPYRAAEFKARYPASPTAIGHVADFDDFDAIKAWMAVPPEPLHVALDMMARGKVIVEKVKRKRKRERKEAHDAYLALKANGAVGVRIEHMVSAMQGAEPAEPSILAMRPTGTPEP